jgi:hypothetical protein
MNLKKLTLIFILGSLFGLTNCNPDCEIKIDTCKESPPSDEGCAAAFTRWFYSAENNKCEQIGYSGCSMKGFDSKQACEACRCN